MKQVVILLVITLIGVCLLPVQHATNPPFANPAFQTTWTDQSAPLAQVDLWGSEPLIWRIEPYANAADGRRVVQYFDGGRMELAQAPGGNQTIVTQGLLAQEITTGQIQVGDALTMPQAPPAIPIDDGSADPRVPTYVSLTALVGKRAASRVGAGTLVVPWIDSRGVPTSAPAPVALAATDYVQSTGHNLPDVTTAFFDSDPFGTANWIAAMGYPISEPYWAFYRRNGVALPSLIQVFQRRILVYSPSLPSDQRFTVTDIGRDYYAWRYGTAMPRQWPDPLAGSPTTAIAVPSGYRVGVFAQGLGTPIGLAVGPAGKLWILTEEGRVLRVDSVRSDGSVGHVTVFAQGLANPRGMAISGTSVYVSVDSGVLRLDDYDLDGVPDSRQFISRNVEPAAGTRGAPIVDSQGQLVVAGTHLPDGQPHVVVMVSPNGTVLTTGQGYASPGPGTVYRNQLYMVDQGSGGSPPTLLQFSLGPTGESTTPSLDSASGRVAAKFATGSSVTAVTWFDSNLWPHVPADTLFATAMSGGSGSVVRSVSRSPNTPPDLVEFATGFSRPSALAVGLDGSLYVADSGAGVVYKIVVPAPGS
ncbi:MAG TPA: hypothetical protein VFN57_13240 [Thermomicrobiaceae bacterium]|nr:hypothetical protein [Thermomicrobiaceae bacterium]